MSLRWAAALTFTLLLAVGAVAAPSPALAAVPGDMTASAQEFATAPGTNRTVLTSQPYRNRVTNVYRPLTAGANSALVIMLTGKSSLGSEMRKVGMDTIADRDGFLTAYPEPLNKLWNAGSECCRTPSMPYVDDIAFLTAMSQQLVAEDGVDPRRIYAVGYSAGSVLAYKWACERSFLAGIGPDAGANINPCPAPPPLTLVAVHGEGDPTFPVNGGTSKDGEPIPSLDQSMAPFKAAASCPTEPTSTETIGRMTVATWNCANGYGVVRSIVSGEKHTWPGSSVNPRYPTKAADTSDFIWTRFKMFAPSEEAVPSHPAVVAIRRLTADHGDRLASFIARRLGELPKHDPPHKIAK